MSASRLQESSQKHDLMEEGRDEKIVTQILLEAPQHFSGGRTSPTSGAGATRVLLGNKKTSETKHDGGGATQDVAQALCLHLSCSGFESQTSTKTNSHHISK